MRFIDREQEMVRLVRLGRERDGGIAAVWGRRRIGKSELLKEWCGMTAPTQIMSAVGLRKWYNIQRMQRRFGDV